MKQALLSKLFDKMSQSKGFPALERNVSGILEHLHDPSKSTEALVEPILSDFAITQKVLKLVNSAMYAPFAKDIASVSRALTVLGSDALSHIVLSASVIASLEDGPSDVQEMSRMVMSAEITRKSGIPCNLEEASVATMIYNLGTLIAEKFLHEEMTKIHELVLSGIDKNVAAVKIIHMTLAELGVEVAKKWKFPLPLIKTIDGTGDPVLVKLAKFSNVSATLIQEDKLDELTKFVDEFELEGLDKGHIHGVIKAKVEERTLAGATTLRRRAFTSEQALHELLWELKSLNIQKVEELSQKVFNVLANVFCASHCLLLFRVLSNGEFRVRTCQGKGVDELKTKFRIGANFEPTAFHAVIKKNVDIFINDATKLKPEALPSWYRTLLPETKSFLVLPIANGGVSGFLYFDWDKTLKLDDEDLGLLRQVRDLFVPFSPRIELEAKE